MHVFISLTLYGYLAWACYLYVGGRNNSLKYNVVAVVNVVSCYQTHSIRKKSQSLPDRKASDI